MSGDAEPAVAPAAVRARFEHERLGVVTLLANDHAHVLLAALEPGQEIPLHAPEADLVVTVVGGSGELYAGGGVHRLEVGDVAVVPAGDTRGIRASSERLLVVNVVTPLPSEADHGRIADGASWSDAVLEEAEKRVERNLLSDREREVLRLLALGHTNQEIAARLFISVRTVETHRAHIVQKLRLRTRAELVRYALDTGLLTAA